MAIPLSIFREPSNNDVSRKSGKSFLRPEDVAPLKALQKREYLNRAPPLELTPRPRKPLISSKAACSQILKDKSPGFLLRSAATCQPPKEIKSEAILPALVSAGGRNAESRDVICSSSAFQPYAWLPVQVSEHFQTWHAQTPYFHGTYVDTLSLDLEIDGNESYELSIDCCGLTPVQDCLPRCWLLQEQLIICKGILHGVCPQTHDTSSGRNARVARLPEGLRPLVPLMFPALMQVSHRGTHLVTLVVRPDGWIIGQDGEEAEGTLDLSAIRFCVGSSLSLLDDARLFNFDAGGKRYVALQGALKARPFRLACLKALVSLPQSCLPPKELFFALSGDRPGCFHLASVRPATNPADKIREVGADAFLLDSTLNNDRIHLSGILYEAAPEASEFNLDMGKVWSRVTTEIFLREFRRRLVTQFGSLEAAWTEAFDTDQSGNINLTEFSDGCKRAGYVGNARRLWWILDEDCSGEIDMDEFRGGNSP